MAELIWEGKYLNPQRRLKAAPLRDDIGSLFGDKRAKDIGDLEAVTRMSPAHVRSYS